MASTDAKVYPKKNTAYRVYFPIFDNDGDLVTGAAALDSEISKDGGTFADCTNEATEVATSSGIYYLDLTSTEMNADAVVVIVKTTTTDAKTTPLFFYPLEDGDIDANVVQLGGVAQSLTDLKDFADAGYDPATNKVQGVVLVDTITTYTGNTVQTGDSFARIGAAGASLTAVPWNASWDAEVQSECADALTAYDPPTNTEMVAAFTEIKGATWATTDTLEAIRDRGDSSWITGNTTTPPTAAAIADAVLDEALAGHATAGTLGKAVADTEADATLILADTNELQTDDIPGLLAAIDTLIDTVITDIAALNDVSTAQVNAEVLDVLNTDTFAEPSSVPAATATLVDKISWICTVARNKRTTTATVDTIRNDADSGDIATSTISDDATTFTRGEYT